MLANYIMNRNGLQPVLLLQFVLLFNLEIIITTLNARRIDSNSVEVTWDFTPAGVAYLTVTVSI